MKKIQILLFSVIASLLISLPANAQLKWGIHAGIVANDLKFNSKLWDSSNRIGFVGGITAQLDLPANFAVQASLDYVHKVSSITSDNGGKNTFKADYLSLPIHLKYNIGIPALSGVLRPFIFTGPSFSYLISKRKNLSYGLNKGDIEWDFGFGADIVKHIQLSVSYGIGCYKMATIQGHNVKTNSWTITLGYLF